MREAGELSVDPFAAPTAEDGDEIPLRKMFRSHAIAEALGRQPPGNRFLNARQFALFGLEIAPMLAVALRAPVQIAAAAVEFAQGEIERCTLDAGRNLVHQEISLVAMSGEFPRVDRVIGKEIIEANGQHERSGFEDVCPAALEGHILRKLDSPFAPPNSIDSANGEQRSDDVGAFAKRDPERSGAGIDHGALPVVIRPQNEVRMHFVLRDSSPGLIESENPVAQMRERSEESDAVSTPLKRLRAVAFR